MARPASADPGENNIIKNLTFTPFTKHVRTNTQPLRSKTCVALHCCSSFTQHTAWQKKRNPKTLTLQG